MKSIKSRPGFEFCVLFFSSMACRPPLRDFCLCLLLAFAVLGTLGASSFDDFVMMGNCVARLDFDLFICLRS
jgi:hypothetical protein